MSSDIPVPATVSTPVPTSVVALEADIAARRARLAQTVEELSRRATPQAIVRRQTEDVKARFAAATTTPEGDLRTERIAAVVLTGLALLSLVLFRRHRRG
ncbi:MAG: DUF3618 domain-containing protein [Nostocoides sp.]